MLLGLELTYSIRFPLHFRSSTVAVILTDRAGILLTFAQHYENVIR